MRTEWICKWQLIPGGRKQTAAYSSQAEAREAMAKVLTDAADLQDCIQDLRNEDGEDCSSSADFLEKFLSDLAMPELEAEIPEHIDIPDHCLLEFNSNDGFRWGYMRGECPLLSAGHVCEGENIEPYVISFNYENPKFISRDRVNAVEIRIYEQLHYGTSAYPLMVWCALREYPQTQAQIVRTIDKTWNTVIDRKAIGRHLQLLKDLGFPVQHGPEGYCRKGEPCAPKTGIQYRPSAYPLLILLVLDETPRTQTAIGRAVQDQYGTKIDRKAVSRHLELLSSPGFDLLQKHKDGYSLENKQNQKERNDSLMIFSEKDFLDCVDRINEKNYDYGNDILYQNCRFDCLPVPGTSERDTKFSSAIWLIGKAYSADPTRSAPKDTFSNNGLGSSFEQIAECVCSSGAYDQFYSDLNELRAEEYTYDYKTDQKLLKRTVLLVGRLNEMIKEAMAEIARKKGKENTKSDNVVSFCSKFLHFMCPHLFFIVDSISFSGGAALFARAKGRKLDISDIKPSIYIDIDTAKEFFNKQYQDLSPMSWGEEAPDDAIISYYTHCLRAYRLACFLNEKGRSCKPQIENNSQSSYMPRLADSILMRITKDTEKE